MVWAYFACARRLAARVQQIEDAHSQREEIVACLSMAVAAVEVFVNAYFRILVSRPGKDEEREMVLRDLDPSQPRGALGLRAKLCHWPPKILGKSLKWQKDPAAAFDKLREKRNTLMHFVSSYQSLSTSNIRIEGLTNTALFDNLQASEATAAVRIAEQMLEEIFRLDGITEEQIPHALHQWTGKPPL